jgi:hypothetical protein
VVRCCELIVPTTTFPFFSSNFFTEMSLDEEEEDERAGEGFGAVVLEGSEDVAPIVE